MEIVWSNGVIVGKAIDLILSNGFFISWHFSCPVCRYVQTPEVIDGQSCFECGSQEVKLFNPSLHFNPHFVLGSVDLFNLWTCWLQSISTRSCIRVYPLFRLSNDHRIYCRHFELTQHTYTMDLKRQHVWDYVGDNYVHRLIQNKGDGKLVELRGEGVSTFELVRSVSIRLSLSLFINLFRSGWLQWK